MAIISQKNSVQCTNIFTETGDKKTLNEVKEDN